MMIAVLSCAMALLPQNASPANSGQKPNVLIVLVDDAGYGDFGCHGHPFLKTPNIDRLHSESVRLTDFHVAPMCSPTRGQLLTGCHGLRTGVTSVTAGRTFLRPEFPTAAQIFADAGWRTGIFGKWHLGDNYPHRPMDKGFHDALWTRGWGFTSAPEFSNTLIDGVIQRGETQEKFPGYITDFCFNEATQWMRARHGAGEPFFCYLPLHAAHSPHIVPDRYLQPFAGKPAPAFFGMLANVDENMGRLDAFLRETGLRENTITIFLTDNGGTAGVRVYNAGLRAGKVTYYDGGHRVPCFVRWPAGGLRQPGDVTVLTQAQDILPTLLDLCGVKRPMGPAFDGVSLAGLLQGKADSLADRTLFVQFGPGFGQTDNSGPKKFDCAVMRNQWRLVHGVELYDMTADRTQERDIAARHPEIVADLRRRYEELWKEVEPRLRDFVPISIGARQENPVFLTSSDWQDTYADNSGHVRNGAGGPRGAPWNIVVERAGEYEIALRRWPFDLDATLDANVQPPGKAFPIASAELTIAGAEHAAKVDPGAKEARLTVRLPAGRTQLQAWFRDAQGNDLCGAFYAKITHREANAAESNKPSRSNVVFILTDNQGAWTLGSYGNPDIRTPNIDRLAREGIRFTRALSSNPVCSPTRATFLTGLIPSQHGIHSFLDPKFMMGPEAYNTLAEFTSLGEILSEAGYACGLSGKWHLGANLTPSEGFGFWVTKPDGSTGEFYGQKVIENGRVRVEEGYTTDLWTRKGIEFMEQHKDRPFFLFLAYNGPYSLGPLMLKSARNRHADYYRHHSFASFPRDQMHPWQFHNKQFHNSQVAMERVAAETSGVDDGVGAILEALKRLGLEESTLVVYAADQGWMGGQNGIWGMGDHTRPIGAHELMMQIPLLFRQPGRIPAERTSDVLVSNYDFLPSLLGFLGISKLPAKPKSPGRDFSPLLRGETIEWDNVVFYEMETCRAVRTDRWKLVLRHPDGPHELYDMQADPRERVNLFGQSGTQSVQADLRRRLETFFGQYADPQYDIWTGGRSKAKRLTGTESI